MIKDSVEAAKVVPIDDENAVRLTEKVHRQMNQRLAELTLDEESVRTHTERFADMQGKITALTDNYLNIRNKIFKEGRRADAVELSDVAEEINTMVGFYKTLSKALKLARHKQRQSEIEYDRLRLEEHRIRAGNQLFHIKKLERRN